MTRGFPWPLPLSLLPFLAMNSIRDTTKLLAPAKNLVPTFPGLPTVIPMYSVALSKVFLPYQHKSTEIISISPLY